MSDPKPCPPTAAEVVGRLKDDGDFDALRRVIVRKVKDNEVLRNKIISEVKQSVILQEDGSEKLKLKDLSDAIYKDIGSKIMGQISDEVWNVIQSNETDIRGTVEAVYNRILNPEKAPEPSSKKLKRKGKEQQVLPAKTQTTVAVEAEDDDPLEPPGFGRNNQHNNIAAAAAAAAPAPAPAAAAAEQKQQPKPNLENHNQAKLNGGETAAASGPAGDDDDPMVPPGFG
ncbi:hypothetical protein PAHAL_9G543100 [Panicum hallii]|uniref:Uncharacterized protein n=1 Tax=Panicum hallii TaxID=206008 RepID=A0A2S3ISQ4_9POAL|nr:uncharacterized protein LOC112873873 [Panicum hallii]PAN50748.1 hypothetical protein PAHAL_9G543100 [Panicum hallii]